MLPGPCHKAATLQLDLPWEGTSPGNPSFIDCREVVDGGRLVFQVLDEGWTRHQRSEACCIHSGEALWGYMLLASVQE
jgi:hypothetical protein